ncbi:MAG: stage III sporulation protein AG [Lachnospiraceae bacterium]|nr:stage III sporulation protein AG [Lachnospiraceae bacterium]
MKWLEKLGGDKKERILILLLAGVLLLVIVIPTGQEGGEMTETGDSVQVVSDDTGRTKEEALEQRLAAVLAQGVGIGKVEVMITLKSDGRQIVEKDMEQQDITDTETPAGSSSRRETTVLQKNAKGDESPFVSEVEAPKIGGVLVLAQGMDAAMANEITEAAMALFGIEAHKIKVMKME